MPAPPISWVDKYRKGNPGVWGTAGKAPSKKSKTKPKVVRPPAVNPGRVVGGYASSAEEEADRIISELLAELGLSRDSARREAERSAQQEIARAQALASALRALGIPGQIQDIYGRSAGSIGALAQGFSGDLQGLAAAQGAEQANMVAGTGQEGAVRNEGAAMGDVMYGTQGFIPARGLEQMGAAFASEAALQPGFTLQFGQLAANKVMQDYIDEVLPEFTDKEALIRSKKPSLVADAKERRRAEAKDLYSSGLITQREFAKRMGVKNWRKFPNVIGGSEATEWEFREVNDSLYAINPKTGKVQIVVKGQGSPTIRSQGGYIWERDPQTGQWVPVGGTGPAPKQYAPKGYQLKTLKDGSTAVFDPNTGATTVIKPPPKGLQNKLTASQKARFRKWALQYAEDALKGGFIENESGQIVPDPRYPRLELADALENLKSAMAGSGMPGNWNLAKSIVISYYRKNFVGPIPGLKAPGKGEPAEGGRQNTSFAGSESLVPSGRGLMGYALSQGFTNLGTYNSASRLPGGGVSDHAKWPAEAFDIGGFSGGWGNAKARRMFQWLMRQPGVKYVILGDKIWSPGRGLHAYTAGGHDTHIHVSLYPVNASA